MPIRSSFTDWLIPGRETPTTEKYFAGANRTLIGSGPAILASLRNRPYRRLGPHLFTAGKRAVLLRHATERETAILKREKFERVVYLLDDDLEFLVEDEHVNLDYRMRVASFLRRVFPKILHMTTDIVAPSISILEKYVRKELHFLGPSMLWKPKDLSHHDREETFRIVFLGTRSHLQDLDMIAAEISDFLKSRKKSVQFDTFLGKWAPPRLKGLQNVRHYSPSGWQHFRQILASHRWHLAIAPMRFTLTNRGRSWNKLLDHASIGAATLHSAGACPMLDLAIGNGRYGFPVEGPPARWREMLEWLVTDRATVKCMARAGLRRAQEIGKPADTRLFWHKLLLR